MQAMCDLTMVSYTSDIINLGIKKNDMNFILQTGGKMLGMALLSMIIAILVCYMAAAVAATIGRNLKSRIFKKVVSFSNFKVVPMSRTFIKKPLKKRKKVLYSTSKEGIQTKQSQYRFP